QSLLRRMGLQARPENNAACKQVDAQQVDAFPSRTARRRRLATSRAADKSLKPTTLLSLLPAAAATASAAVAASASAVPWPSACRAAPCDRPAPIAAPREPPPRPCPTNRSRPGSP